MDVHLQLQWPTWSSNNSPHAATTPFLTNDKWCVISSLVCVRNQWKHHCGDTKTTRKLDWLMDWLTDWLMNWLVGWLIVYIESLPKLNFFHPLFTYLAHGKCTQHHSTRTLYQFKPTLVFCRLPVNNIITSQTSALNASTISKTNPDGNYFQRYGTFRFYQVKG